MVKLKVLLLNQFFYPDVSATAQLLTELAQDLSQNYEVLVLTGRAPYSPQKTSYPTHERIGSIEIHRVFSAHFGRSTLTGRLINYFSFYFFLFLRLFLIGRPDVTIVLSTPPLLAVSAWLLRKIRGVPYIYWVQDLYPEIAAQIGVVGRDTFSYRVLRSISSRVIESASAVVVISAEMQSRLQGAGKRVEVIHNWADGAAIWPVRHKENPFRQEHGLSDRFVVLYSGNLGLATDVMPLVTAVRDLAHDPSICFLVIGDGPRKLEVLRLHDEGYSRNLKFLPYQPKSMLSYSLSAGDASLILMAKGVEGLVVPSKLYAYMASGRPVIYVGGECETAQIIRTSGCGRVLSHENPHALAEEIGRFRSSPDLPDEMGRAGRAYFELHYEKHLATARFRQLVGEVIA